LSDLWHRVRHLDVLLTAWALHEIESNALCAPSVAQKLSNAACVENVTAVKFEAWLIAEGTAANETIVHLGDLVVGSAHRLDARKMIIFIFSFATTTLVATVQLLIAALNLAELRIRLQLLNSVSLREHHAD